MEQEQNELEITNHISHETNKVCKSGLVISVMGIAVGALGVALGVVDEKSVAYLTGTSAGIITSILCAINFKMILSRNKNQNSINDEIKGGKSR